MRKVLVVAIAAVTGLLMLASTATAHGRSHSSGFKCDDTYVNRTFERDIVVPPDGECKLINSRVRGKVKTGEDSYFEADNSRIRGSVRGNEAQTLFIHNGTRVYGGVNGDATVQVFVFGSKVTDDINVVEATDQVFICGSTVTEGDINVLDSSRNILVGDPLAASCPGNVVRRGDVRIDENFTDVELIIRGNTIRLGDLTVTENFGSSEKIVADNVGGHTLRCEENDPSFAGSPNASWASKQGQCAGP